MCLRVDPGTASTVEGLGLKRDSDSDFGLTEAPREPDTPSLRNIA